MTKKATKNKHHQERTTMQAAAAQNLSSATPRFRNILVVIKQTAFEEYTQVSERTVRPTHAPQPAVMIDASRGVGHFKRQGDGLHTLIHFSH
jgi:hypothetical protein